MLFTPDLTAQAVHQLTPALLKARGAQAVMVDLDDTLVASNAHSMSPQVRAWIGELKADGFLLLILSNGEPRRVRHWAQELDIPAFALVGKPCRSAFRKGLERLGSQPQHTVMIGDQLFTDVVGANLMGLTSILVTPLSPGKLPHTRAARQLERLFLRGGDRGRTLHR